MKIRGTLRWFEADNDVLRISCSSPDAFGTYDELRDMLKNHKVVELSVEVVDEAVERKPENDV